MMDPLVGKKVCYVQFPQRFDGIDRHDRYANRNVVFFDVRFSFPKMLSYPYCHYRHVGFLTFGSYRSTWKVWMVFKDPSMWVLDVSLDARHCMVMMLRKPRSHHQELAIAGPSGASLAAAAETRIRRLRNRKQRRKRKDYFSRKKKIHLLHTPWAKLRKVLQVLLTFQTLILIAPLKSKGVSLDFWKPG